MNMYYHTHKIRGMLFSNHFSKPEKKNSISGIS
jgi:hypothetical protein